MTGSLQFNELVLELYQAARRLRPQAFKRWSLQECRPWLEYDQAYWACGRFLSTQRQEWFQRVSLPRNGTQVLAPAGAVCRWVAESPAEAATVQLAAEPDGTGWLLASSRREARAALVQCIVLHRARAFQPEELLLKRQLFAHLHEASLINNFWNLRGGYQHDQVCYALCDLSGLLIDTEREFVERLAETFSDWRGPRLPFAVQDGSCYLGEQFRIRACPCSEGLLLKMEPLPLLELLTPKQREVAALLVEGWSYKAIARRLDISPSTVTNHSNAIYQRLGVSSKSGLIQLWDQARDSGLSEA